jgi:hypothetical protein
MKTPRILIGAVVLVALGACGRSATAPDSATAPRSARLLNTLPDTVKVGATAAATGDGVIIELDNGILGSGGR